MIFTSWPSQPVDYNNFTGDVKLEFLPGINEKTFLTEFKKDRGS